MLNRFLGVFDCVIFYHSGHILKGQGCNYAECFNPAHFCVRLSKIRNFWPLYIFSSLFFMLLEFVGASLSLYICIMMFDVLCGMRISSMFIELRPMGDSGSTFFIPVGLLYL